MKRNSQTNFRQNRRNGYRTNLDRISMRAIKAIANRIAERFDVEKIILFGSYAYGKPNDSSDVDLLIVMTHHKESNRQQRLEIARAISPRTFPMDILVRTPMEIKQRIPLGDYFLKEIIQKGKVLYAQASQ